MKKMNVTTARAEVRRLMAEHPRKKNPVKDGSCVYEKGTRHCIVGQLLVDNKLPMPAYNDGILELVVDPADNFEPYRYLDERAASYLASVQRVADGESDVGIFVRPISWGKIDLDEVEEDYRSRGRPRRNG